MNVIPYMAKWTFAEVLKDFEVEEDGSPDYPGELNIIIWVLKIRECCPAVVRERDMRNEARSEGINMASFRRQGKEAMNEDSQEASEIQKRHLNESPGTSRKNMALLTP